MFVCRAKILHFYSDLIFSTRFRAWRKFFPIRVQITVDDFNILDDACSRFKITHTHKRWNKEIQVALSWGDRTYRKGYILAHRQVPVYLPICKSVPLNHRNGYARDTR